MENDYFAFISYQRKDEQWAEWLLHQLEHYHLPSNVIKKHPELPKELRPLFLDKNELAGGILPKEIRAALESSRFLIVICSPNSAKSEWVDKEVMTFIELGRTEKIIPFIIDGIPYDKKNECFTPALQMLKKNKQQELLGINIAEMGREVASIKVVARMLGLKFDTLWQRYEREKAEEERGIYKRVDLLKMHAYKDAIRRTSGAYIIYPGTEHKKLQGFHEILPGLGAFCLNPNSVESDSKELERFLQDIVEHMLNRTSQRERIAYHTYETYKQEPFMVCEAMPEPYGTNRDLIPEETFVLIGSFHDENHLKWILNNKIYNARTGTGNGSLHLKPEITTAKYVLLHKGTTQFLLRLSDNGPRVMPKEDLEKKPHASLYTPSKPYYVVFDIDNTEPEEEFRNVEWDISKMCDEGLLKKGRLSAEPEGVSLSTLMKYKMSMPHLSKTQKDPEYLVAQ